MKKILSLVLALVLVLSMAAFTTASAEADIVKLTWAQGTGSTAPLDNAMVLEELNKISVAELGVEVDIQYFTDDQLQISIQSGEVFDMYYTCDWYNNFARCVSQGLFADITDKVKEWTPDLYATMPEYVWDLAKTSDGVLYAIPVKKDFAPINMLTYDLEFFNSIGMELPDRVEKMSELTPYLEAWKEAHPDRYPITVGGSPAGLDTTFDFIDRTINIGVHRAVDGTQDEVPVVISEFEDPVILDRWATMHAWYEAGLVNPDAPTLTEDAIASKGKDHNHFTWTQAWNGYDWSSARDFAADTVIYSGPYMSSAGVQGSMNAFSVTLEDDLAKFEKALKYQELVNTNLKYRDTLRYGVEGYHWNYVDVPQTDGSVKQAVIRTEAGQENYGPWAFSQGSYSLASISISEKNLDGTWAAPVLDQWDLYFADVATAKVSTIAGFMFDSSNWDTEYAEIQAIKSEYWNDLTCGVLDPEVAVPEILEKMRAAGLDDIIADCQAQLDAYLAK